MIWTDPRDFPPMSRDADAQDFVDWREVQRLFFILCGESLDGDTPGLNLPEDEFLSLFARACELAQLFKEFVP